MTNGTDNKGILSRVVRSIAGPARDLMARGEDSRLSQYDDSDRAELKAMIERKRRNDFVRKRELDMLRRIRREGLTPEQAAALNANSRLDESDVRGSHPSGLPDRGVKAKIDAIEKQMVGVAPIPGMRPGPPGMPPPVPAPRCRSTSALTRILRRSSTRPWSNRHRHSQPGRRHPQNRQSSHRQHRPARFQRACRSLKRQRSRCARSPMTLSSMRR